MTFVLLSRFCSSLVSIYTSPGLAVVSAVETVCLAIAIAKKTLILTIVREVDASALFRNHHEVKSLGEGIYSKSAVISLKRS